MTTGKLDHIIVDDNNNEIVDKCIFLGVLITNDEVTDKKAGNGKCTIGSLKRIFKDRGIKLTTTIMIVQKLVFPIILYGTETWTIKKAVHCVWNYNLTKTYVVYVILIYILLMSY